MFHFLDALAESERKYSLRGINGARMIDELLARYWGNQISSFSNKRISCEELIERRFICLQKSVKKRGFG